jgi:hypothetical protein
MFYPPGYEDVGIYNFNTICMILTYVYRCQIVSWLFVAINPHKVDLNSYLSLKYGKDCIVG